MKYQVWNNLNSIKTRFEKGQTRGHYPKGRKNPKLSETRKRLFAEGKLKSIFQTDKNPSKLGIPHKGYFKKGQKPWNYREIKRYGGLLREEWNNLRMKIRQRDGFTCQNCYAKGVTLDTHHISPYALSKDNSMKNLITLCRKCHTKIENTIEKNRRKLK